MARFEVGTVGELEGLAEARDGEVDGAAGGVDGVGDVMVVAASRLAARRTPVAQRHFSSF